MKSQIVKDLQMQKMADSIRDFRNTIEDAIAGGKKLADIAKEHNLRFESFKEFSKNGTGKTGSSSFGERVNEKVRIQIIDTAFSLSEGQESPLTDIDNSESIIITTDSIIAPAIPAFEEIKTKIEENWRLDQQKEQAREVVNNVVQNAKNLNELSLQASKSGLKLISGISLSEINFQRYHANNGEKDKNAEPIPDLFEKIDAGSVERAFGLKLGQSSVGLMDDGYVILMLDKIVDSMPPEDAAKKMAAALNANYQRDMQGLLLNALKSQATITQSDELINQIANQDH
jgi:hypothetical protein